MYLIINASIRGICCGQIGRDIDYWECGLLVWFGTYSNRLTPIKGRSGQHRMEMWESSIRSGSTVSSEIVRFCFWLVAGWLYSVSFDIEMLRTNHWQWGAIQRIRLTSNLILGIFAHGKLIKKSDIICRCLCLLIRVCIFYGSCGSVDLWQENWICPDPRNHFRSFFNQ